MVDFLTKRQGWTPFPRPEWCMGEPNPAQPVSTQPPVRPSVVPPVPVIAGVRAHRPDEGARATLSRLASLLEAGLLTREEFDNLKAQLLGGS
jgi:hypothetical protein